MFESDYIFAHQHSDLSFWEHGLTEMSEYSTEMKFSQNGHFQIFQLNILGMLEV